jgi:copper resistance protein B
MKKRLPRLISLILLLGLTDHALAMFQDDPWLTKFMSEFEYLQEDGEDVIEWDIDVWTGRDLSKFWIKSAGEIADSETEQANIELVYSHAVSAYWDQQFGVRHDFKPAPDGDERNWVSYGFIGTAPYFVSVDARVFVGEESSTQLLIELEREMMITQEWVFTPELDIVANGRTNQRYGEGSGLAAVEFSLRLGYERNGNRKFQPFVGLTASQTFGSTRRLAKLGGESSGDIEAMIGIHSWF